MNKYPLKNTHWFDSSMHYSIVLYYNAFTYLRGRTTSAETKKQVPQIDCYFVLPDMSYICTAVIMYKYLYDFVWITVPCGGL